MPAEPGQERKIPAKTTPGGVYQFASRVEQHDEDTFYGDSKCLDEYIETT
jgi:hypothetical protein